MRIRHLPFLALMTVAISHASAAAPSVTAVLSSSEAAVGQTVQMQVRVAGERRADLPDEIAVDGLEIRRTGTEQHFEMNNFNVTSSVTYNFTILPEKAGTYKIPPQMVRVGSATLRTPELTLRVVDGGRAAGGGGRGSTDGQIAFAELIVPKKTAYVGELIPVVLRFGVPARTQLTQMEPPDFSAQGFTVQRMVEPELVTEEIGGRPYQVRVFKTAISATRTGKFDLGPVRIKAAALMPRRNSGRSPFDVFGSNDPFSDPMLVDPFSMMAQPREINAKSEPVPLEIKPLPAGAPASFNGAVGNFTLASEANPKRIPMGDPITIKSTIAGRGNFDRVEAPSLSDDRGWHKYPATGNFKRDDDVGISGSKTFEMVVSPNEKKSSLPPLLFSYFDPTKEKYITLQSDSLPIVVEGGVAPAPTVASANSAAPTPGATAGAPQILQQLNQRGENRGSFARMVERREFWLAQLLPLALVASVAGVRLARSRGPDRPGARKARWQREADEALRGLRRGQLDSREYFAQAARIVQLRTAARTNMEPASVDADTTARVFALDEQRREELQRLFARSDELRYSGGAINGASALTSEQRAETLATIENLRG